MKITQELVKEYLHYCPLTGDLYWKNRPRSAFGSDRAHSVFASCYAERKAGTVVAARKGQSDYIRVSIGGKGYAAHRIAWLICYGYWPVCVDHIDGDGTNNVMSNLREVSHSENHKNMPKQRNNKSGVTGVSFVVRAKKWESYINVDGVKISLGYHFDFFEAVCARKSADLVYGFHENHGRAAAALAQTPST